MKFTGTIKATKELKTSISALQSLVEEATFEVTTDGIKSRGLDMSGVSYVSIDFPKSVFIKFECEHDTKFTVRTHEFLEIIKRAKNDDELTLEMNDLNALQVYIGGKKHYVLPLVTTEKEPRKLDIELQTQTKLKFTDFVDYVKDIGVISENFVVVADEDGLKLSGKSISGKADVEVDATTMKKQEGVLRGEYMMERLLNMIKVLGTGFEEVKVEHGNDLPLRLTFENKNMGTLIFAQAPKVS